LELEIRDFRRPLPAGFIGQIDSQSGGMSGVIAGKSTGKSLLAIAITSTLVGAFQHAALPGGLFTDRAKTRTVVELAQIPSVSPETARQLVAEARAVVVDARPLDVDRSVQPSAISIPIGLVTNEDFVRSQLALIPTGYIVLVHCGSTSCGQSRVVAAQLLRLGRADVRVIRGTP
jgi:hypothetical protein